MPGSASGEGILFSRHALLLSHHLADGNVGAERLPINGRNYGMRQGLTFFREKPIDEQFCGVGVRRIGKYGYATTGAPGANHADLFRQKNSFDRQPLLPLYSSVPVAMAWSG